MKADKEKPAGAAAITYYSRWVFYRLLTLINWIRNTYQCVCMFRCATEWVSTCVCKPLKEREACQHSQSRGSSCSVNAAFPAAEGRFYDGVPAKKLMLIINPSIYPFSFARLRRGGGGRETDFSLPGHLLSGSVLQAHEYSHWPVGKNSSYFYILKCLYFIYSLHESKSAK